MGYMCDRDGDHNTGTAGMCTGDLANVVFSFVTSGDTQGDVLGTWDNSDIVDVGLPIPVIEHLIALPVLGLEPLADLVLANSQCVPFGGSGIFPFSTCAFEWVMCIVLILEKNVGYSALLWQQSQHSSSVMM